MSTFLMIPSDKANELFSTLQEIKMSLNELKSGHTIDSKNEGKTKLLSRTQMSKILGVTLPTLDKWKNESLIPFKRICRRIYFDENEVMRAMKSNVKFSKFKLDE